MYKRQWYHRTKTLQADGSIKYSKKGGFATSKEADKSYDQCEAAFTKAYRAYQIAHQVNKEIMLKDYLIYWFEEVFSQRVESTTRMVGAYAIYDLIMPHLEYDIKVRLSLIHIYKRRQAIAIQDKILPLLEKRKKENLQGKISDLKEFTFQSQEYIFGDEKSI